MSSYIECIRRDRNRMDTRDRMDNRLTMSLWLFLVILCSFCGESLATHQDFYFKTTPKGAGTSDDIVFVNPDCEEIDNSDCPDVDPNALINPRVTFRPTPEPTSTASTLDGGDPDEPCDPDDEDCLTGSGSGFTVEPAISTPNTGDTNHDLDQDKDIDIDQDKDKEVVPPGKPSPDTPIIIDVNMTETPFHHAVMPSTPTPHGGQEGGVNRDNQDSSGSDGKSQQGSSTLGMNIGLIVGIALGVVLLLLIVAFAFYKYKSRDEGSYKMDESKNYSYETCNTKPPPPHTNGGLSKSASNCSKSKKRDVKEWYV